MNPSSAEPPAVFYANDPPIIDPARRLHLMELVEGWDSYGGHPITPEALHTLERMSLVPLPSGGWVIEVHGKESEASIEVNVDGEIDSASWNRNA